MPDYKVYSETEYQARYEAKMADIGEYAHQYLSMLLTTKESYWFKTVRAILGLCEKYDKETVNLSLKRALYYEATDLTTIKHILSKKLYLLELEPKLPIAKTEEISIKEPERTLNRELSYYTILQ